jgi:Skp family chaperone for outer membrane proteins
MKTMIIQLALLPLALALSSPMLCLAQESPANVGAPSASPALTQAPKGAAGHGQTAAALQKEQSDLSAVRAKLEGQLKALQSGNSAVDLAGLSQKVKSFQELQNQLGAPQNRAESEAATKLLAAIDSANKTAAGSEQRSSSMGAVEHELAQLLGSSGQGYAWAGRGDSPIVSSPKFSNPVKGMSANLNFDGSQSHSGQTPVPAAPAHNTLSAPVLAAQAAMKGPTASALSGGPVQLDKAEPPPPAPESHAAANPAQPAKAVPPSTTKKDVVEAGAGVIAAGGGAFLGSELIAAGTAMSWDVFVGFGLLGAGAGMVAAGTAVIVAGAVVGAYLLTDAAVRHFSPTHQGITERIAPEVKKIMPSWL